MEYSRQECWSGMIFPSPGNLPDPGMEPRSPASQADSLLLSYQERPLPKIWNTSLVCGSSLCRATILQWQWLSLSNLKTFPSFQRETLFSSVVSARFPSPVTWQPLIYSFSVALPLLGVSHEWSHTTCGLLAPPSFTPCKFQSSSVLSHVTSLHFVFPVYLLRARLALCGPQKSWHVLSGLSSPLSLHPRNL